MLCVAAVGAAAACDRKSSGVAADSASGAPAPAGEGPSASAGGGTGWIAEAGPVLVLPTVDGGLTSGSLLRADATDSSVADTSGLGAALGDGQVELFARSGPLGPARLTVELPRAEPGCSAWPVARLVPGSGSPAPWTAAFLAGRIEAIALDSIEGIPARDSSRLAVELTRLASGLRDDTVATFRGLPFVVLRAWRSKGLDTGFVVATLARRVNQEDSPREERLVLVVDQVGTDARQWTVSWHERASGSEDELVVAEPLLAYRVRGRRDVHLLFGRDDGVALSAAVLTRVIGAWTVQWESAIPSC